MKPVKTDVQFPALEESVLAFWKENGILEKGLAANKGQEPFVFYDGPPFATGLPHYGHILPGTLKDIVPRYWVMKGKYVQRRWGWDCHGLPVELVVEKELGLRGRTDILEMGIGNFNEACRGVVSRFTKEWESVIERTGRWVDFKNNYRSMDTSFMESVWWVIKQLWDKGLIYEGHRVMPYSWRLSTPLSNFEAGLNYKEVQDPSLTVRLKRIGSPGYFLAWTTTPWTLPSNLALAVGPKIVYVEIDDVKTGERYILAKDRLASYYKAAADYTVVRELPGAELEGLGYEPLFPHFAAFAKQGAFKVVLGDHVTTTDGTGIVHTAPAFGEEDFAVGAKYGIPLADPIDAEGKFTALVPEYEGQLVKDADKNIIKDLKAKGSVFKHDTLDHNYPFCWRSDTPLIYKAITTWFVKLDPLKADLIANNKKTHWVPEHLRDGRFGNWLENARDWNISRNRFWGTPIPLWRGEDGEMHCVGSIAELEQLTGKKFTDIHSHFIDDATVKSPATGKPLKRIPEVLDCWFESGSMPYAQAHYPFENKEAFDASFPADFIAEGIDQTRGWFYTLSVLSTALFGKAPFQNVIVNGLVLAEDGKKMSKRLNNYPDPKYVLDTYGADGLRAYLMTSPASHAEDLRFSESGVKEIVRAVLLPFWNAYSFFVTYAIADEWDPKTFKEESLKGMENELDKWMVSRLQSLVRMMDEKMAVYHLHEVIPGVIGFIDELTNWYIRLNRRRFWAEEKTADKEMAYSTLYFTLTQFCKVLAPILPFITEDIYQNLARDVEKQESVHLCKFPLVHEQWIQPELEREMELVRNVVQMGRNCRNSNKLKTRQPLAEILIITKNPEDRKTIEQHRELIGQELNMKKVSFSAEEAKWVNFVAKANFTTLGKKLGPKMKAVSAKIREMKPEDVTLLEKQGFIELEGEKILVSDILIERQPKLEGAIQSAGNVTVWLDTKLSDALVGEGIAREFVNRIQKLRKDSGLDVTDRINVAYQCPPELKTALHAHHTYISSEVLASTLGEAAVPSAGPQHWTSEQDIDGFDLKIFLEKA